MHGGIDIRNPAKTDTNKATWVVVDRVHCFDSSFWSSADSSRSAEPRRGRRLRASRAVFWRDEDGDDDGGGGLEPDSVGLLLLLQLPPPPLAVLPTEGVKVPLRRRSREQAPNYVIKFRYTVGAESVYRRFT